MATSSVVLILVFFVYGLAFFSLGLVIALESRRSTALALASSLNYLAAFALLHAVVEWLEMLVMINSLTGDHSGIPALRPVKPLLLAVSALCLLQFAVKL